MNREIKRSGQFKKDYKRIRHDDALVSDLTDVIGLLAADLPLPEKFCDHDLLGIWEGCRDCHVRPDVVLIYEKYEDVVRILKLLRIGSHPELFRK